MSMAQPDRVNFYKYQGAGNDFIMIDNRDCRFSALSADPAFTAWMCDRKYGVGADGILEIRARDGYDFEMVYTREEGVKGPYLCGNGSRCIVAFAHHLKVHRRQADRFHFLARDGPHVGWVDNITGEVHVQFKDMDAIEKYDDENFYIHVGNERHVVFVTDLWGVDVLEKGRHLGYQERYMHEHGGCNVMFVQIEADGNLSARSFEAQIDYEPLACGTGAVASALVNAFRKPWQQPEIAVRKKVTYMGGNVEIMFDRLGPSRFENVFLIGPAKRSFKGSVMVEDFPLEYKYKSNTRK